MWIVQAILLALSLCADCFAVSAASSVTLRDISARKVIALALVFGAVQTLFMFSGWLFGDLFVGYIHRFARWVGFFLLLYVGGSLILEAIKGDGEAISLDGFRNILIGAVATSIDAFAVGIGLSMGSDPFKNIAADPAAVLAVTVITVVAGIYGGSKIGVRFGKPSEIVGGIVLILIGLNILLEVL